MILFRVGITYRYLNTIRSVQQFLRQHFDDSRNPDRKRTYRKIRLVVVTLVVTYVFVLFMQLIFGVFEEPFFVAPPHLLKWRFLAIWFKCKIHVTFDAIFSSIFAANLTIINTYLIAFDVEMKRNAASFEKMIGKIDKTVESKTVNTPELSVRQREMITELRFVRILKRELFSLIKNQIDMVDQLHDLKKFLNTTFMCMFYTQMVVSGCLLFFITLEKLTILAMVLLSYGFTGVLECFWYCQLTNNLNESNQAVGYAAYCMEWSHRLHYHPAAHADYREIRNGLLIIMINSQKKLGISCGGMFEMSIEAFSVFMKMTYNCLMFLLNST
ncbi:uncharacterized protein LOC129727647 [Wyeomyia smithii]|uniref:uncharacterized protein LOC129727647 n=1 Tax=Wyeomyia smithii TaxID=174621 RepID=UPI002467F7FE|nr:uncharacterized protein LOC129727647 [Wyeomyia smithii]